MDTLGRTISDISYELTTESSTTLPLISKVKEAKCECCGMLEECMPEYIQRVRETYARKLVCGLCLEAVKEEMGKNGGKREKALVEHMNACVRFNWVYSAYPMLCQAVAMRKILKNSRCKSFSPRDPKGCPRKRGVARSSSCILAVSAKDLKK